MIRHRLNTGFLLKLVTQARRIVITFLFLFLAGISNVSAQYISEVLEYIPAPGQNINTAPWGIPSATQTICGGIDGAVTLGAFGGYVVFKFNLPVENHPENPYGIDFTVFGNPSPEWSEPGIVSIMKDENENGLPDDIWYELAGSDYYFSGSVKDYQVTYTNPGSALAEDVPWSDNLGNTGNILANSAHTQTYYPLSDSFPSVNNNQYTLSGGMIQAVVDSTNIAFLKSYTRAFGYADNHVRGNAPNTIPDNPYTSEIENSGGDAFDIEWAIDTDGNYVNLDQIDFVRIHNAVLADVGWLGELSTEVCGAVDVEPDNSISGVVDMIIIKDLPKVISTSTYLLEVFAFHKGRLLEDKEITWASNMTGTFVDENNVLNLTIAGELELTASFSDNPSIYSIATAIIELSSSVDDNISNSVYGIYPNPASENITISGEGNAILDILDLSGRIIYSEKDHFLGGKVNISGLSDGIYLIRLQTNHSSGTLKFIKK